MEKSYGDDQESVDKNTVAALEVRQSGITAKFACSSDVAAIKYATIRCIVACPLFDVALVASPGARE